MGQVVKPNLSLSTTLVLKILEEVMKDYSSVHKRVKFDLIVFGTFVVINCIVSLRESEGLMIDLTVVNRELKTARNFCVIVLKGKLKGESVDQDHLFPCICHTSSRIDVQKWLKLLSCAH